MVSRKGAQRFSVRHFSHRLWRDYGAFDLALLRRPTDRSFEAMERGPADSRRRPAGAPGETRHTHDGRRTDRRFGFDLDSPVGATLQRLRLDRNGRDSAFCGDWFYRRLREDGEAAQSRIDRATEVAGAAAHSSRSLGSAVYGDEAYWWDRLFVEPQYSVSEVDGRSGEEFYRSLYIPDPDRGGVARIFERSEPD